MTLDTFLAVGAGFLVGVLLTGVLVWKLMPRMMIETHCSRHAFDETVAGLQESLAKAGWTSPGMLDLKASIEKHGESCPSRVKVVQLCNPRYASQVLKTDRYVSCLMPCSIAVWEADDGQVHVSKMNTGLMGKLFGGNIARVMGQSVARDEHRILADVVQPA